MKRYSVFLFIGIQLALSFGWAYDKTNTIFIKTLNCGCRDLGLYESFYTRTTRGNFSTCTGILFRDFQIDSGTKAGRESEKDALLFNIDGNMADWKDQKPLWTEAGVEGRGPFESSIDVKQVYFKNDDKFLFVFMQLSPTIEERFKNSNSGDIVGYLYIDTDNDPQTGSSEVVKYKGFEEPKFRGYDVKIFLPVGIISSSKGKKPYVGYEIRLLEGSEFSALSSFKQNSFSKEALISHGNDGIEFALPLDKIGLKPPRTIRVMLAEQAHFSEKVGYTAGLIDLE